MTGNAVFTTRPAGETWLYSEEATSPGYMVTWVSGTGPRPVDPCAQQVSCIRGSLAMVIGTEYLLDHRMGKKHRLL
jgi:hypothetical protein